MVSFEIEEAIEILNEYIHSILGFHTKESQDAAWKSISRGDFQLVLQSIEKFESLNGEHFIVRRWKT
jgi:hypothetical protein